MITCKSNNSTHLYLFLPYLPRFIVLPEILYKKFQGFFLSYRVSLYHDVPHMARKSPETVYSVFMKVLSVSFYPHHHLCGFLSMSISLFVSLPLTSHYISFVLFHHICMNESCNNKSDPSSVLCLYIS